MSSKKPWWYNPWQATRSSTTPQPPAAPQESFVPAHSHQPSGVPMAQGRRPTLPSLASVVPDSSAPVSAASPYHTGYQPHQPHQSATYADPSYSSYSAYSGSYSTQPYQQPTSGGYPEHTSHSGYSSYSVAGHSGHPGHPGHSVYAQRSSPPISSKTDARRLRPLSIPHSSDRYQSTSYYAQSNEPTVVSPSSDVRSPHPSYPSGYAQPSYHAMPSSIYATTPGAGPSRPTHAYGVSAGQQYPAHSPHSAAGVERTVSSRHAPPVPYARTTSVSAADYEPVPEPTIKKKRKRADARQLEVLNSVYGRTAFPSTEERSALGVQLGMSARSVQIWFQNKRQAMRSGGGRGSSSRGSAPPPAPAPVPSPPTPLSAEIPSTAGYPSSRYGRPPSTPATRSTRSPPEAVTTYGSRSPPPGPPSSHSAYSSHMLATRSGQPYASTRGGQPYVPTRGY